MSLYDDLVAGAAKLSVVGLGYVGMPLAVEFAKRLEVVGFDVNKEKIDLYKRGVDPTNEVGDRAIADAKVDFTSDPKRLREALFHIVAVPTPINQDKTPDLSPVVGASKVLGENLRAGSVVVFESTVYPGVTENVCIPVLEEESGLRCGVDFWVGYSPERINPGDKIHTLPRIKKVVSGMDGKTLDIVKSVYDLVIEAGTHPVSTIKTAEAIKVVENSQRDINIAFMNELAMVFDRMGIDTNEVVEGLNTKWNALGFKPGLVGGHCIGVDPYYFTYEAEKLGYHSQIILSGRRVNDGMGEFVADIALREMVQSGQAPKESRVVILGLTFKENCPDIRNSKVEDIIERLAGYGIDPKVVDPWADSEDARRCYGIALEDMDDVRQADCVIVAVAHDCFKELGLGGILSLFGEGDIAKKVLIDVKGIFSSGEAQEVGCRYWSL